MTFLCSNTVICSICSQESEQSCVLSTNASGMADLDTRPPEDERSTMHTWVQRCPSCGYCSYDISQVGGSGVAEIVKSDEYIEILGDSRINEFASTFMAFAYLSEVIGQFIDAAWNAIYAAWVCDDIGNQIMADEARHRAIYLIRKGKKKGRFLFDREVDSDLIIVDLLRRVGRYDEAKVVVEDFKTKVLNDQDRITIKFQNELIKKRNRNVYTLEDIDKILETSYDYEKNISEINNSLNEIYREKELYEIVYRNLEEIKFNYAKNKNNKNLNIEEYIIKMEKIKSNILEFIDLNEEALCINGISHYQEIKLRYFNLKKFFSESAIVKRIDKEIRELISRKQEVEKEAAILEKVKASKVRDEIEKSAPNCSQGHPMVLKNGVHGYFWGCSSFPKCRETKKLQKSQLDSLYYS